jgi:signal transduction histidine kinase
MVGTASATLYLPAERVGPDVLAEQQKDVCRHAVLAAMLEGFPEPAVVLNGARQVVRANARLTSLLGCDASALVGRRLGEVLACEHASEAPNGCGTTANCRLCGAAHAIERASTTDVQATEECRISAVGDRGPAALDLRVWVTPIDVDGASYLVVALRDTSDEQRRRVLERMFFHDVLNAAGGLHGLLTLLPDLPPARALEMTGEATRLAGHVVEEIEAHRDLSAAERGELVAQPTVVGVATVLADVAALYGHHPVAEGRTLDVEGAPAGAMVTADPVPLRRALGNLVKNALEASARGGRVGLSFREGPSRRFEVHNAGVMSEEVRLQVFQRSFSTKGGRGRGVGTYSARLLVERCLGGTIGFSSTEDAGTTFWIALPPG